MKIKEKFYIATHQKKQIRALIVVGMLMLFSCPCDAASFPQYAILDLGTLGGEMSIAYGVNEQGAVAGKSETREGYVKAFYWDSWGMVEIGLGKALGLNDLGRVVGNIHHHNDDAFVWDVVNGLGFLNKGDFLFATATGIGNSGKVVGYARKFNDIDGTTAILWDPSQDTPTPLGSLGGPSYAFAVNGMEEVVGNSGDPSRAFIWDHTDGMKDLGVLNEEDWRYYATDINDRGQVVGYARTASDEYRAFIWERDLGMRLLPGDGESLALAVNGHGHAVGAQGTIIGLEGKAYLWRDGSRIDLNQTIPSDSGWELREARGITDDGTICGNGLINGEIHACLLKPVPSVMVDIKANGSDLPITVSLTDIVSITVTVDPSSEAGLPSDWWVVAETGFAFPLDWYSYVYPTGWAPGIQLCLQAPLFFLTSFEVLHATLPLGNYVFYLAVDHNANGVPDAGWWDSVSVMVE